MVDVPYRTTHNDAGIHRVLEQHAPSRFNTVASYATEAEALAFIEGARLAPTIDPDLARQTYDRALAKKKGRKR
jgi:hypothetical protein